MNKHLTQLHILKNAALEQRIPQSLLFVGPAHCALIPFSIEFMQFVFCKNRTQTSCLTCIDCTLIQQMEHPDIEWIKPDKSGGAIKIDQIRALHSKAYLTPQRSIHRFIVIESADWMNIASANALLKILEEPASHTVFILIAEQLGSILPTVLSRCQVMHFSSTQDDALNNLLSLGAYYADDSARALIIQQAETILDDLIAVIEKKQHPCALASKWGQYEFHTLLWFLSLVFAQIQMMHGSKKPAQGLGHNQLTQLVNLLNPIVIFAQMDKLNSILRKLSHNMNINNLLALEDLLFFEGLY